MVFFAGYTEQAIRASRARWLTAFAVIVCSMCFFRLGFLQLVRGQALSRASENNHTQIVIERAPRGRILDRNGAVLAGDQPVFVALFSPLGLAPQDFDQTLNRLSQILTVPTEELHKRLQSAVRAKTMMRVSDRLNRSQAFHILQERIRLPGISLTVEEQRYYPGESVASHVLGYVGQITDDELERFRGQGYRSGDWIGKTGLERLYDPTLHGQDGGILIQVDARGRQVRVLRHVLPRAGRDLVLTIDQGLQQLAETRLRETGHPGAAVVMDVQTGEVLTLASAPQYNPNIFLPLGDSAERSRLLNDPDHPLYNRAIQAFYPPASTFKTISGLAMLQKSGFDPNERVFCPGFHVLGKEKRVFKCWKPGGHGSVDFIQGMAQSCDVYYYTMGTRVGAKAIEEMARLFGLGKKTGIDLPNEKNALLPMEWKQNRARASERYWSGGDTLNYSIGQGFMQVTPLQMAQVASLIANGGQLWQPYLASRYQVFGKPDQVIGEPRLLSRITLREPDMALLHRSLLEVVRTGTGVAARIKGVEVAGKTGTAQASKGDDHAWFISYAPADAPKYACAVVVEHGGHGGAVAAPIAHDLMARVLGHEDGKAVVRGSTGD